MNYRLGVFTQIHENQTLVLFLREIQAVMQHEKGHTQIITSSDVYSVKEKDTTVLEIWNEYLDLSDRYNNHGDHHVPSSN